MSEPTWNESPATRVAELVRRLRSGEYKQGQSALQRDGKFCCLGVACDMAVQVGVTRVGPDSGFGQTYAGPDCAHTADLPPQVQQWLGFDDGFGETYVTETNYPDTHPTLASLNDDGLTFDQIADVIEAGLVKTND